MSSLHRLEGECRQGADAIYLQQGFVKEAESFGWDWVISLKENQPELLAEAQRLTSGVPDTVESTGQQEHQLWHAPEVYWAVANRSVWVVKAIRRQKHRRVRVGAAGSGEKRTKSREEVTQESTNYSASNLELGSIPPRFVYELGRSRWRIDTEVFQTLTPPSPPQAAFSASPVRADRADHDSRAGLHTELGLLPSPSRQPCSAWRARVQ
ncbi:MAG: transposase [Acidobacteria bacterium]|nr:transposase [Acidobacteriota bacterium]